jgi:hypothetical protein
MKLANFLPMGRLTHQVVFPEVDPVRISKEVDIPHRAASAKPPHQMPTAGSLDLNEEAVQDHHRGLVAEGNKRVGQMLAASSVRSDELSQTPDPDFSDAGTLAEGELDRHKILITREIVEQARQVLALAWEKRQFQHDHKITREPRQRESNIRIALGFALVVVLEGLFNMNALSAGVHGGLLEALLTAMVLAAANVGAGFAAGFAVREILHTKTWRGWLGGGALAGYLVALCTWAALLGYYREMLVQHPDAASAMAVQALIQYGYTGAFLSVQGVLLIGVTIAFGLLAMLSVFITREPYPAYARLGAQLGAAHAAFTQLRADYLAGIDLVIQPISAAVMTQRDDWISNRAALRQHTADVKAVIIGYDQFLEKVRLSVQQVCAGYRRIRAIVSGQPIPAYAGSYNIGAPLDLSSTVARIDVIEKNLDNPAARHDLDRTVSAAQAAIRAAAAAARNGVDAFFAECEAKVQGQSRFPSDETTTRAVRQLPAPQLVSRTVAQN